MGMPSTFKTENEFEWKKKNQRIAMLNERGFWDYRSHLKLSEYFTQRPALKAVNELAADFSTHPTAAELLAMVIANKNFSVIGTNMTTALCTFSTNGGVTLTTAGASSDQGIILPSLTTGLTAWSGVNWVTDNSPRFEVMVRTPATITSYVMWAGLKLTNTDVLATDDDQVMIKTTTTADTGGSATNFTVCTSRGGVDVVTVLPEKLKASTLYRLTISLNASRKPNVRIASVFQPLDNAGVAIVSTSQEIKNTLYNLIPGTSGQTGADGSVPLVTAKNFIPYVGVKSLTSAARALDVLELHCGKAVA